MESYVRVRVTASQGSDSFTQAWKLRVEDADTGKLLMVFPDGFSIHQKNDAIVLTGSMLVHDLNIECGADLTPIVAGSPDDPVTAAGECTDSTCVCVAKGRTQACTLDVSG